MAEKFSVIFLLSPFSFLTFFVIKIFHLSTRNRKKEPLTQNKRFLGPKIAREIEFCRQEKRPRLCEAPILLRPPSGVLPTRE